MLLICRKGLRVHILLVVVFYQKSAGQATGLFFPVHHKHSYTKIIILLHNIILKEPYFCSYNNATITWRRKKTGHTTVRVQDQEED